MKTLLILLHLGNLKNQSKNVLIGNIDKFLKKFKKEDNKEINKLINTQDAKKRDQRSVKRIIK
jgi:hypothetical protein